MKYCEKCGQELTSTVCEFCGQQAKPSAPALQQPSNNSQERKFRWFRSDKPKRYLAEMSLMAVVALIALLVIIPSFQDEDLVAQVEPQRESEQTEITEDTSEPDIKKETKSTEDPIEPESSGNNETENENNVGSDKEVQEPSNTEEGDETTEQDSTASVPKDETPSESVEDEAELEPKPPIEEAPLEILSERERFLKWKESIVFTRDPPQVVSNTDGNGCLGDSCVKEDICFTFDTPDTYSVGNLDGEKKLTFSNGESIVIPSKFLGTHWSHCWGFVNENPGDLSQYSGDYRIEITFPNYGSSFEVTTENSIFDLRENP